MPQHALLYLYLHNFCELWIVLCASDRRNILLVTTFAGYQINNVSNASLQFSQFLFHLTAKQEKSVETTKNFFHMSHFLLHCSIKHSFCLVVLENSDGDKVSVTYGILGRNIKYLLIPVKIGTWLLIWF